VKSGPAAVLFGPAVLFGAGRWLGGEGREDGRMGGE